MEVTGVPENEGTHLVQARLTQSLLLRAQIADSGHELTWVHEQV